MPSTLLSVRQNRIFSVRQIPKRLMGESFSSERDHGEGSRLATVNKLGIQRSDRRALRHYVMLVMPSSGTQVRGRIALNQNFK